MTQPRFRLPRIPRPFPDLLPGLPSTRTRYDIESQSRAEREEEARLRVAREASQLAMKIYLGDAQKLYDMVKGGLSRGEWPKIRSDAAEVLHALGRVNVEADEIIRSIRHRRRE